MSFQDTNESIQLLTQEKLCELCEGALQIIENLSPIRPRIIQNLIEESWADPYPGSEKIHQCDSHNV
jgi:hypothetical protein